jgi:hypothetical protein
MEDHAAAGGLEPLHDHRGARQRGVAAERHFKRGREPAQRPDAIAIRNEEGGFGEIVLGGDGLHHGIGREGVHRHHGGGTAGHRRLGKRIDLEETVLAHRDPLCAPACRCAV